MTLKLNLTQTLIALALIVALLATLVGAFVRFETTQMQPYQHAPLADYCYSPPIPCM